MELRPFLSIMSLPVHHALMSRIFNNSEISLQGISNFDKVVEGPLLVVSNHQSMYDSWLIYKALASLYGPLYKSKRIPWSVPEASNYADSTLKRALLSFCRCIPVERGAGMSDGNRKALSDIVSVLSSGGTVSIFPGAGRDKGSVCDRI